MLCCLIDLRTSGRGTHAPRFQILLFLIQHPGSSLSPSLFHSIFLPTVLGSFPVPCALLL